MSKNLLISEEVINVTERYTMGESEVYETFTDNVGKLFRSLQKEYGRCAGKVFLDIDGKTRHIGWVFEKKAKYADSNTTYDQQVWVMVHREKPCRTTQYYYEDLDNRERKEVKYGST